MYGYNVLEPYRSINVHVYCGVKVEILSRPRIFVLFFCIVTRTEKSSFFYLLLYSDLLQMYYHASVLFGIERTQGDEEIREFFLSYQ